jgi:hypothetical protein
MSEQHTFRFDEDKAYEDQLVSVLKASAEHLLSASEAPHQPGVFVLLRTAPSISHGRFRSTDYHQREGA